MITSTELARRSGASYRKIDWWTRRGHLLGDEPGQGQKREHPDTELRAATALARCSPLLDARTVSRTYALVAAAGRAGHTSVTIDGVLIDWSAA